MSCDLCGAGDKRETRPSRSVGRTPWVVISCHRLECGHQWHCTTALVGANVPGVIPATPPPLECMCPDYLPPKRNP
jgi:hypothetical protein